MTLFENNYWLRGWARFCDYCLTFLLVGAITLFLPFFYSLFFYFFLALAVPLLWVPLEAIFLSKWGTTPGKKLFGIYVGDAQGNKLSFYTALKRALFISPRPGIIKQAVFSLKRKLSMISLTVGFALIGLFGNLLTQWGTGIGGGITAEGWVQYSPDSAKFKVSFPTDPEQQSKQLVLPTTGKVLNYEEISSAEDEKVHYSLTHMEIPRKWKLAGEATLLKGALDAMAKHSSGTTILNKQFIVHQKHRALNYTLKQGEKEIKGRMIIVGTTMYKLAIEYPQSQSTAMQDNPFLDSFDVS